MIDTLFLHSAPLTAMVRAADRLAIPARERVLLTCRPLTDPETALVKDWYVIELPVPGHRWETSVGKQFWTRVGKPRRLIAPSAGVGYPGVEFRNVLRFLAIQRGLEKRAIDREGRMYRITWGSIFLAGTFGKVGYRQLAGLLLSLLLAAMRAGDRRARAGGHPPPRH